MLETGDVSILFSLTQMKNLGMTVELDPKGDEITRPAFGLFSSPAEHSTMGHIVLDLTNGAYQSTTKSLEQPGHQKRHETFAMTERRPAYPAHAPDMHEDAHGISWRCQNHEGSLSTETTCQSSECSWRLAVRTRWLNKLRPAGASHRRKGCRAR